MGTRNLQKRRGIKINTGIYHHNVPIYVTYKEPKLFRNSQKYMYMCIDFLDQSL